MAAAATWRRRACRARRVRRERERRAGGAWVRRTRSAGRAPRSCVRPARFVSSAIRAGIPEADWADLGAAAELTPSAARDARSGRDASVFPGGALAIAPREHQMWAPPLAARTRCPRRRVMATSDARLFLGRR